MQLVGRPGSVTNTDTSRASPAGGTWVDGPERAAAAAAEYSRVEWSSLVDRRESGVEYIPTVGTLINSTS